MATCAVDSSRGDYRRRRPESTVLYQVVQGHLETLLAEARDRSESGWGYPAHVEKELRRYLACGILAHGFARVRCTSCGSDRLVAFSCKGRALCPSCQGRRMADVAAHLCDHVLPDMPYRQWVMSFPYELRWRMARDPALLSRVLGRFVRAVFMWQRAHARRHGVNNPLTGSVSFPQRFGSVLNLNVHFHTLVPDGVFERMSSGELRFVTLPPPEDADIEALVRRVARKVRSLLAGEDEETDDLSESAPMDVMLAEAVQPKLPRIPRLEPPRPKQRCAHIDGFSLHANVAVHADDRAGLERLIRYGARPAFSHQRLTWLPSGKVSYKLRKPWYTGQTELVFEPIELLRRLVTLIPPPRQHLVRFHGVFAPGAKVRPEVVAMVPAASATQPVDDPPESAPGGEAPRPAYRRSWAELFRRVFSRDVLVCPDCQGRCRVIAVIEEPTAIESILTHLGLPIRAPPIAPARAPPQLAFSDDPSPDAYL